MTDDGVQALAMKLPLLHFIGLQATGITDASVDALMKGASANILRTVYIYLRLRRCYVGRRSKDACRAPTVCSSHMIPWAFASV